MGIISTAVKHAVKLGATPEQILELVQALEAEIVYIVHGTKPSTQNESEKSQKNHGLNSKNERYIDLTSRTSNTGKGVEGVRGRRGKPKPDLKFNQFWAIFPRRQARGAAERAFRSAMKRASLEEILAGAQKYADSRRGEDKQYTCLGSTWLNQDRWLDEDDRPEKHAISGPKRTWAEIKEELIRTGSPLAERWTRSQKPSTPSSEHTAGDRESIPPCSSPAAGTPISSSCGPPSPEPATTEATRSTPSGEPSTGTEPPSSTTLVSLRNRGGTEDALVPGHGEAPKRGASSKEPEMARIRDFLPALLRVDDPPQDQAQVSAEAVFDEVLVCGYPWDEPEAFNL